jgi:pimeloyl-ACP methyl ester carboxylesterase
VHWRTLAAQLAGRYRVIAPDLHGYGRTPDRVRRRSLVSRTTHLVGHLYGGAVALHVARTAPHRLASLSLIEPVAFHLLRTHDPLAFAEIAAVATTVARAVAAGDHLGGMASFVDCWSGPATYAAMAPEKRKISSSRGFARRGPRRASASPFRAHCPTHARQ